MDDVYENDYFWTIIKGLCSVQVSLVYIIKTEWQKAASSLSNDTRFVVLKVTNNINVFKKN